MTLIGARSHFNSMALALGSARAQAGWSVSAPRAGGGISSRLAPVPVCALGLRLRFSTLAKQRGTCKGYAYEYKPQPRGRVARCNTPERKSPATQIAEERLLLHL